MNRRALARIVAILVIEALATLAAWNLTLFLLGL